ALPSSVDLLGVACAAGACMIIGVDIKASEAGRPLAMVLRGNRLRVLKPLTPTGATAAILEGVSCVRPSSCVAIGTSIPGPDSGGTGLAETWNGTRWRIARIPHPKALVGLQSVACPSSTTCMAVGWPVAGFGRPLTMTLLDRNGRWRRLTEVPA